MKNNVKGNGIVLLNQQVYSNSMAYLFINKNKFKEFDCDHTLTWLNVLQTYLRKLKSNGEITEAKFTAIIPKNACPAKASSFTKNR